MEFRESKAIYLQIADLVCSAILAGQWVVGDRVPSVREQAALLTVNPATVMRGYDYLCTLGVITVQRGVGYEVAEGAREKILAARREEFFTLELPSLKARMDELGIEIDEVIKKLF
ncbi:MAG: GntR family transcriptional regulator [Mucinivorans sp.]